jgi:hypothetical protein
MKLQLLEILTIGTEEGTLNKLKNGTFKGVFNIDKDAAYEFKYVIDGAFVNETGRLFQMERICRSRKQCFRGLNL